MVRLATATINQLHMKFNSPLHLAVVWWNSLEPLKNSLSGHDLNVFTGKSANTKGTQQSSREMTSCCSCVVCYVGLLGGGHMMCDHETW